MKHARWDYAPIQDPRPNGIPAEEPVMLFRGQDRLAAAVLDFYADRLGEHGADPKMAARVREQAQAMRDWKVKKLPDVPEMPEGT
jgi:hypothetical protein